ncbi:signal peptidase I [Clostridium sp. P21]|uniref:Signal peptidase I n=1 Tax=Clostridium muellerianum TaxID=2716538 RepID=A0A7Y0EJX7_9CLOT|nr:signal peptidase I [Clostridium muellerianum]NMM64761.1 signal peptidase I [Clostridium muellerianum]
MDKKISIKETKELIFVIVTALVISLFVHSYVFARVDVDGPSMQSTLHDKDVLFIEKISTEMKQIKRGDIVVFDSKDANDSNYIKRVIGIENDQIELKNGKVYLNNQELNEPYLDSTTTTDPLTSQTKFTVPKGCVFVLGDNRTNSTDSRILGPINLNDIKGHAIVRVFPFNTVKSFF